MSYSAIKTRVQVAEQAFANQVETTQTKWYRLKELAGEAFTPARIVATGALTGLAVGFTAPWARIGGTMRIVELGTSIANLVGALQAQAAAEEASDVADSASEVVVETAAVAEEAQAATEETQAAAEEAQDAAEETQAIAAETKSASKQAQKAAAKAEAVVGESRG
jgi:methyl-accepting chemotaxis protein